MTADRSWDTSLRRLAGPAVRSARRRWQWWTCPADLDVRTSPVEVAPCLVVRHATPVVRHLAGVDLALQRSKATNLRLAAARLDGLLLRPGQRLSFWRRVGPPTARRGFVDGLVLDDGRLVAGVGGGLCQLTNLIYWMTLHTPLDVVERWRHTYDVFPDVGRTQPFGTGATCAYPSLDLQIENRTPYAYRLAVGLTADDLDDASLAGSWSCEVAPTVRYQVYEAAQLMTNDAPGVFTRHNTIRRRVLGPDGAVLDDEPVTENHARLRYQPFLPAA